MRIAKTLSLLIIAGLPGGCVSHRADEGVRQNRFEYRTAAGDAAILDLNALTITTRTRTISLNDCSDVDRICLQSREAKIDVPRDCRAAGALEAYIPSSEDLEFGGLEGLSGNVFKIFRKTGKFGYAYHTDNGLVQLVIIPEATTEAPWGRMELAQYVYRIHGPSAPFGCR